MVFDKVRRLEDAGRQIHTLAADAEHVAEEFLSQAETIRTLTVGSLQQPAAHPLLNGVVLDAGAILRTALDEHQGVPHQQL